MRARLALIRLRCGRRRWLPFNICTPPRARQHDAHPNIPLGCRGLIAATRGRGQLKGACEAWRLVMRLAASKSTSTVTIRRRRPIFMRASARQPWIWDAIVAEIRDSSGTARHSPHPSRKPTELQRDEAGDVAAGRWLRGDACAGTYRYRRRPPEVCKSPRSHNIHAPMEHSNASASGFV